MELYNYAKIQKVTQATWSLLAYEKSTKLAAHNQRQVVKSSYDSEYRLLEEKFRNF
jgi:hypothetical protein